MSRRRDRNKNEDSGQGKWSRRKEGVKEYSKKVVGWETIEETADTTRDLFDTAFGADKPRPRRVETFDQAVRRQNLSEMDLKALLQRSFVNFAIFSVTFSAACLLALYWVFNPPGSLLGPLHVIATLAIALLLLGMMFKWSFLNWRIRNRRLGGLGLFLRSPGAWIPGTRFAPRGTGVVMHKERKSDVTRH